MRKVVGTGSVEERLRRLEQARNFEEALFAFTAVSDEVTTGGGGGYTDEQAQDAVAAALVAGAGITIVYNDAGNTITIAATGAGGGTPLAAVREIFTGPLATAVLAATPATASERVLVDTTPQRRVASSPGLNAYSLSGNTITFGDVGLAAGEVAVVTYWSAIAVARKEEFTGPAATLVLASAPFAGSEVVVIDTVEQRPGAGTLNEYTISGATITLGTSLATGELAWVTYWTAAPSAMPRHDDFVGPATGLVLSATPIAQSEIVVAATRHQRRVMSAPGLNAYTLSGQTITLGTPLAAGEAAWVDYFA